MSNIKAGQKVIGTLADILNREFSARTKTGLPLAGWRRSAWPSSSPFLKNGNKSGNRAVVWFPYVTKNPNSQKVGDWLNVVSTDWSTITMRYVGNESQEDVYQRIARFTDKEQIVFGRNLGKCGCIFYGIYSSERVNDTFVYRRIADEINTQDWLR